MKPNKQNLLLTVEEVCSIIKVCGESSVGVLKFADLYVEFGPKAPLLPHGPVDTRPSPEFAAEIANLQKREAERALVADEIAMKEARLSEAIINDPLLAEELFIQGELSAHGGSDEEET